MDKFQNKYRIPSARLQSWDYGANGAYFITICTAHREHYFGEIVNDEMKLNAIGLLAEQYWMEIPNHFPFVELGNFVVMPNHIHGILIIDKINDVPVPVTVPVPVETLQCNVSTTAAANATTTTNAAATNAAANAKNEQMAKISPKSGTISTIIRSYKSVVSKNARIIHADFAWQARFHDHIIRDSAEFERIQNYIANNPMNWKDDKFNSNNV